MPERITRMRATLALIFLVTISSNATAQTSFLVPLLPAQNVPGAQGSLWSTDLVIENSSDHNVFLQQDSCFTCGRPPIGTARSRMSPWLTGRSDSTHTSNGARPDSATVAVTHSSVLVLRARSHPWFLARPHSDASQSGA